ncbi:hypothetical protein A6R68_19884, partial [Neotoma lepida]
LIAVRGNDLTFLLINQIINLNFCEKVGTGLTFNKKELQGSFVFDIKTSKCPFYLVAETEANMNKTKITRSASLSQGTREKTDKAVQKLAQGSLAFYSHMKGSLTGYETDNEDVYTFKTPNNTLCQEFRDLIMDNRKGPSRRSEIQPPLVNCNLKPDWKTKPTPLDLHLSPSLGPGGTDSRAPKKCTGKVNYIALDFQSDSLSPPHKPSTSSVTSDKKIDYAQEKTQALQTTIQKWTDI